MRATTPEIKASHAIFVSHPVEVARVIERAVRDDSRSVDTIVQWNRLAGSGIRLSRPTASVPRDASGPLR
jgi:hypothetical protein